MCGIAGIVGRGRERLPAVLSRLAHRGPDARGALDLPDLALALGHVRLSIIDLDVRANQPFVSRCGRYALVFNGEIYNYVELRAELEAEGCAFRTSSDTEVLLELLIRRGELALPALDGMFAFALADRERRTLFLARDPIGEKPLYYAWPRAGGAPAFAFASEIKGLLALEGIDLGLEREALADYLRFLYTPAPRTLRRGVRELPPGCWMRVRCAAPSEQVVRYYDLEQRARESWDVPREEALERFRGAFERSLCLRLRSDVPVGVFLSGGIDSNAILGVARAQQPAAKLSTYTVRFAGSAAARARDEGALAARAARERGASNQAIVFTGADDLAAALERQIELFDQPFGNSTAVIADALAGFAARETKVCLAGDGGDEVLAGYPRYKALGLHGLFRRVPRPLRAAATAGCSVLGERGRLATTLRRIREFAEGVERPLAESFLDWSTYVDAAELALATGRTDPTPFAAGLLELFERNQGDPIRAAALVDFASFVPFNLLQSADRTSMAHGLELRTPFLSTQVIETALRIPSAYKLARGRVKPLLVDALPQAIPPFLARQKKRPFNPPIQDFVRRSLPAVEDLLLAPASRLGQEIDPAFTAAQVEAFRSGRRDNSTLLWGLAALELWLQRTARPFREPAAA